jgi:hypothetical protein
MQIIIFRDDEPEPLAFECADEQLAIDYVASLNATGTAARYEVAS